MYVRGKGVSFAKVAAIVASVSDEKYAGNVIVHPDAAPIRATGRADGYGFRGRVIGKASRGEGTRTSASGRRGPWACWHSYRDVMAGIFREYPHAVITTAHARYEGAEGFETNYPRTARVNVGSMANPARMASLCECAE